MSIAVISDAHGNRWALDAVLDDIRPRGLHRIVNLGGCFYGPLDPRGTAEMLLPLDLPTVRGNEGRILLDPSLGSDATAVAAYVRARLAPAHLRWIESLPTPRVVDGAILRCHGSPGCVAFPASDLCLIPSA